jgi:hypothetical protein
MEVLSPEWFREEVVDELRLMMQNYTKENTSQQAM